MRIKIAAIPKSLLAVLLLCMALYGIFIARTAFLVGDRFYFSLFDDAMISMRYARNLVEGHGLVWNPGEGPVEGYSNLLWTLVMAILHLAPVGEGKVSLLVMIVGVITLVAVLVLTWRIAGLVSGSRQTQVIAVCLTGLYYPLFFWTLRGMEVGFLVMLLLASTLLVLKLEEQFDYRRLGLLAALMVAALLTRTDAFIPCLLLSGYAVLRVAPARRVVTLGVLAAALLGTLATHTAFRIAYYQDPLPNTYYLKVRGSELSSRVNGGLVALGSTALVHLVASLVLAGNYLFRRLKDLRGPEILLAGIFGSQCAYSIYVGGDAWEWMNYSNRYLTTGAPFLLILAAMGVGAIHRSRIRGLACFALLAAFAALNFRIWFPSLLAFPIADSTLKTRMATGFLAALTILLVTLMRGHVRAATTTLVVALAIATNTEAYSQWWKYNGAHVNDDAFVTRYGLELRASTAPDAKIAVTWEGAIPYFSRRPSIGILGKTDKTIARLPDRTGVFAPGHSKWDYKYSIGVLKPDVIAQVWRATDEELSYIYGLGYQPIDVPPIKVLVRSESGKVDRSRLRPIRVDLRGHR